MRVTQIFNVYLEKGGEENYVDFLEDQFRGDDRFATLRFYSSDWKKAGAPNKLMQALKMYHNREALERLREHERVFESDVWLLHNIFPVGSAAIFALARKRGIRTVVVTHNFRPFSVSGYLWADHGVAKTGLRKNFFPEIREGAWRSSSLQTAWYAILLWVLHARGTFRKVSHWIAISDFMREQFIGAGIDPERITTLKHVLPIRPLENFDCKDEGYYLYLGRLVEMKGLRFLVEAWESLGSEGPLLKICGDGPEE
ncbi:MAG: glycosyltransferase, partial [Kiritimatiellia bacterium]